MLAVFATLLMAYALSWLGRERLAVACLSACFALAIWLFMFEIYSPDYGFRMPWLQLQLEPAATTSAVV